jgi:transcriptional antiterminator NusG
LDDWLAGSQLVNRGRLIMSKRWYVIHAFSGFEKQVQRSLTERITRAGMEDFFGDVLVPTEEVVEMKGGQKRRSDRKFFPGYVLVEMEMNDETWHLVKEVPKVMGFIGGTSDKPAAISEKEANTILSRVQEGVDKPRPKILFEPGEMVRVVDGPFNDFNGTVEEVNYEKSRLRVAVLIFGRSTPVELNFHQVEKA